MKQITLSVLKSIDKKLDKVICRLSDIARYIEVKNTPIETLQIDEDITQWWMLNMKKEYSCQHLFDECEKLFKCYCWIDLSKIKSDRNGDYTIEFEPNIEADEQWRHISANDLPKDKKFITLEERLLLELQYFQVTKNHLDNYNWTLIAGSRDDDGGVPCVGWCGSRLQVGNCHPGNASGRIRSRSAVHFSL